MNKRCFVIQGFGKKQDYEQTTPGTIDVPVIEFSTTPEDLNLKPFLKSHKIQKGETLSN